MYKEDSDHDILHPWEIQEILIETLDKMDSLPDQHAEQDPLDEFEHTLEDEEINIIRMSHDPYLRHYTHSVTITIYQILQSTKFNTR